MTLDEGWVEVWHLYEVVISNTVTWLKLQSSCSSLENATEFFERRFTGADHYVDGDRPVMPFKLSQRSDRIVNWRSIVDRLPAGWDDREFHIAGAAYPWCETLTDDCDCHGKKGGLLAAHCSDFGLEEEADKRARKAENVRYRNYILELENQIARNDRARREARTAREERLPRPGAAPVAARRAESDGDDARMHRALDNAVNGVNRLVADGFYCSIHGRHHPFGEQAIRKTVASLTATHAQASSMGEEDRNLMISRMGDMTAHWLQSHQSEECAQRSVWGDGDIPDILYKYIPEALIGKGAPNSLRATQLRALNDDMECNVITMKGSGEPDTLAFLAAVQSKLEEHLGIAAPWEEFLLRVIRYGDLRLSTFIQEYLNPLVGVVSFSTDILVPTMWAHYARNTGIVVGYEAEALRTLGFELRPVVYSEIAPVYEPSACDVIRLDFVNREYVERDLRAGRTREGLPLLARTDLTELGADWKSLARLLLVKGISWAYEKEVRLLVDLEQARDTGQTDDNSWPVKVIDPPPEAIREIYAGANTRKDVVERAARLARGDSKKSLFVGGVSSHAFRIQKTGGVVNY